MICTEKEFAFFLFAFG